MSASATAIAAQRMAADDAKNVPLLPRSASFGEGRKFDPLVTASSYAQNLRKACQGDALALKSHMLNTTFAGVESPKVSLGARGDSYFLFNNVESRWSKVGAWDDTRKRLSLYGPIPGCT